VTPVVMLPNNQEQPMHIVPKKLSAGAQAVAQRVYDLRSALDFLRDEGQYISWPDEVLPEPGIREVMMAASREANTAPAIMFDKVRGYEGHRVVAGVHGSWDNLALFLGRAKGTSIRELFFEIIGRWGSDTPLLQHMPSSEAPVNENRVERGINLYELLPLYRINEYDGGFFMGKASTVSHDPLEPDDFSKQNVGIYRIQVHGPDLLTLNSVPSHDLGRQIVAAELHDKPLRVAIMIGNHPGMALFAATPVNYDESEYAYASQMMGATFQLTKSGNGLDILAHSEIVIEAELIRNARTYEGPFGEFPGSYSGVKRTPLFRVTAVSHRDNPIFESIYVGKGWTEHDTLIGLFTSAPIYAQLRERFPEVTAVNALYQHGYTGIIAVNNRYAGFAKSVAMATLGLPHGLMYLKNIILVDGDVDPFDLNSVMWALSTQTRGDDIIVLPNMPMMMSDPAAVVKGKGHRLIIDATSFVGPDKKRHDTDVVRWADGGRLDELSSVIRQLQAGESLR
jgi:vanillate/4-hydroxybenzoate decarboxylase subunit C